MHERRRIKRRKTSFYLPLLDPTTGKIFGHLVDITPQGLMVDSRQQLPVGHIYDLRLETTGDTTQTIFIEFTVRTKWSRTDPIEPNLYDAGLEIVKILPQHARILQQLMEKYSA